MNKTTLRKYARLIVRVGANVRPGQDVIINASLTAEDLVAAIVRECYLAKARKVRVEWSSLKVARITASKADVKVLSSLDEWEIAKYHHIADTLPAMIHILSDDPDGMKGIDQAKLAKAEQARYPILKPYRDQMENRYQWTIAGAASLAWARKVFPDLRPAKAIRKLWEAILYTSRCDEGDPLLNWQAHNIALAKHAAWLNSLDLDRLHYVAGNGTDFVVGLNHRALWLAGQEKTEGSGVVFNPNIPSEECFTSPLKGRAEGVLVASKPLSVKGELVEDFSFRFHEGKVVDVKARKGEHVLRRLLAMDEGASYLGEAALVPYDSPISRSGILFFNTLYDENAACHFAIGRGFTNCLKDYDRYSEEERRSFGVNASMIHVDFMVGTPDLKITGTTRDGREVLIFKDGNWADEA